MATTVGRINLGLSVNKKTFNNELKGIASSAEKSTSKIFGSLGSKIGLVLGSAAIISFTKSALKMGSDLAEVQNVVDTVFKNMSGSVNAFASTAIDTLGISETLAKKYMGIFGSMSKSMGMTESQAFDMAKAITSLTGDVASFYNLSSDEAYTKLKSIWTGETESLKELGVVMTQVNLDNFALQQGFGKTTKNMTEQEKLVLRYQYVLSKLSHVQGDFARNIDSWANQTRVLSLRFDQLKATIGQGLINLFTPIVKMINTVLARLQVLAEAFQRFTEMLTGKKSEVKGLGAISAEVSDAAAGLNEGAENLGDGASKAAKKIQKALAGFDELNVLDLSSDSDSGSSGLGAGVETNLLGDMASGTEQATQRMTSALDELRTKIDELIGDFKAGFSEAFGESNVESILESAKNIKTSVKDIFTSPEVTNAAGTWANSVLTSLGKVTGSVAGIGATIAELLVGSIDTYLVQNTDFIRSKVASLFNISAKRAEIFANFSEAIADIFTVFRGQKAQQIGADIVAIFTNSGLSILELGLQYGNDFLNYLTKPIIENKDKFKTALENTLNPVSTIVGAIKTNLDNIFQSIWIAYQTWVQPAWDNMEKHATRVWGAVLDAYNKYLAPTLDNIANKLSNLMSQHVTPFVKNAVNLIGKITYEISRFWNFVSPFVSWLIDKAIARVANVLERAWNIVEFVFKQAIAVANDVINTISGLVDFIVGIFTLDWERAWNGIKEIFDSKIQLIKDIITNTKDYIQEQFKTALKGVEDLTGIKFEDIKAAFNRGWENVKNIFTDVPGYFHDKFTEAYDAIKKVFSPFEEFFRGLGSAMKNAIKGGINGAIDLFNKFIGWINDRMKFSWDGLTIAGKKIFDGGSIKLVEIQPIQPLAKGGIVNAPTLAMIGEAGKEAVLPLENNTGWMDVLAQKVAVAVAGAIAGLGNNNTNIGPIEIKLEEMTLGKAVIKSVNAYQRAMGKTLLEV